MNSSRVASLTLDMGGRLFLVRPSTDRTGIDLRDETTGELITITATSDGVYRCSCRPESDSDCDHVLSVLAVGFASIPSEVIAEPTGDQIVTLDELMATYYKAEPSWQTHGASLTAKALRKLIEQTYRVGMKQGERVEESRHRLKSMFPDFSSEI